MVISKFVGLGWGNKGTDDIQPCIFSAVQIPMRHYVLVQVSKEGWEGDNFDCLGIKHVQFMPCT